MNCSICGGPLFQIQRSTPVYETIRDRVKPDRIVRVRDEIIHKVVCPVCEDK